GHRLRHVADAHASGRHRVDDVLPGLALELDPVGAPHRHEQIGAVEGEYALLAEPARHHVGVKLVLWRIVFQRIAGGGALEYPGRRADRRDIDGDAIGVDLLL